MNEQYDRLYDEMIKIDREREKLRNQISCLQQEKNRLEDELWLVREALNREMKVTQFNVGGTQ